MKSTFSILITIILLSCSQEPNEISKNQIEPKPKKALIIDSLEKNGSNHFKKQTNFTDSNGLKQGKWITKGYKNNVVRIETFRNDTLNGYWFNWEGMQEEGRYVNGKKHGLFSVFYGNKSEEEVMLLKLFESDSVLWFACPTADKRAAIPIKGFKVNTDSIFIEAPHYNGSIWYKGLFVNNQPQGIHFVFDENEHLLARTNYLDSTIQLTEFADEDFIRNTRNYALNMKVIFE